MVRIVGYATTFIATVTATKTDGTTYELGRFPKVSTDNPTPSDVFDYANEAQGYFRFAIQEMPEVSSIAIEVSQYGEYVELKEITRD